MTAEPTPQKDEPERRAETDAAKPAPCADDAHRPAEEAKPSDTPPEYRTWRTGP